MKIGILTFHFAHNYGAVLQAYALQSYLMNLGHHVEIINHVPPSMRGGYKKSVWRNCISWKHPLRSISKLYIETKVYKLRKLRWIRFNDFINNNLAISKSQSIDDDYDVFVIGSDQVWNTKITKGFHEPYFCKFPFEKGNRIYISYAASMEATTLTEEQKDYYRAHLKNFDFISVRENMLASLLQPLTANHVYLTLDPTLLVGKSVWEDMIEKPISDKKYVLFYRVWNDDGAMKIAKRISVERDAEVIELVSWLDYKTNRNKYQAASPIDFVTLFKYADFIVTDSFHGTAFSIIFHKDFFVVKLNGSQSRSESLLAELGLQDRIVGRTGGLSCESTHIDYNEVGKKLDALKEESSAFLNHALGQPIN